jgi:hypothetical protein
MAAFFKPVLLFIISILIFAGFIFLADKELFNLVETRFYNPSIVKSYIMENTRDAELVQSYIFELQNRFAAVLKELAVQNSFFYDQSPDDIYELSRILEILLESTVGLYSVQFVDSDGIRINYSVRNYPDVPLSLPYDTISVSDGGSAKFTMDDQNGRIIFSFPFYDSTNVYRGTALFTISVRALAARLAEEGRLKMNDDVSVIGTPPGILFGGPDISKTDILRKVSAVWKDGAQGRVVLDADSSGMRFSLISLRADNGIFFGRLVNDSLFYIPGHMKLILQLSMFLTLYLTLFFLINFRPNPVTIVRTRIKYLRDSLFDQFYVNKTGKDRYKWILELEQRREEICSKLKRNLRLNRRSEKEIDGIIDKSWNELLAVIKSGDGHVFAGTPAAVQLGKDALLGGEVEEIEEAEMIKEIEEAEDLDDLEEIEDIAETEELNDAEELFGEIDEDSIVTVHVHSAKGLLELASEIEKAETLEETKKLEEATPAPAATQKGLLALASRQLSDDEPEAENSAASGRGLLAAASEIGI